MKHSEPTDPESTDVSAVPGFGDRKDNFRHRLCLAFFSC